MEEETCLKQPARLRKRGRPRRNEADKLEGLCVSLPPEDIERLHTEAPIVGGGSISGVVRVAVSEFFHRLDKRRARID